MKKEIATFGMGCFWRPQALFDGVTGVLMTKVGFMGDEEGADYSKVCSGKTNHAETVYIEYDAEVISYKDLLDVFWKNHNPTTKHRQGPDIGSQYRSVIFYYTEEQKKGAEESMKKQQKEYGEKIVTEIVPAKQFFPAEEYHQKYYEKQGKNIKTS